MGVLARKKDHGTFPPARVDYYDTADRRESTIAAISRALCRHGLKFPGSSNTARRLEREGKMSLQSLYAGNFLIQWAGGMHGEPTDFLRRRLSCGNYAAIQAPHKNKIQPCGTLMTNHLPNFVVLF